MRNLSLVVKGGALVWSELPGYVERAFNVVAEGLRMDGGTFNNW